MNVSSAWWMSSICLNIFLVLNCPITAFIFGKASLRSYKFECSNPTHPSNPISKDISFLKPSLISPVESYFFY